MYLDPLEKDSKLTAHDYEFLKGNEVYWPIFWGAAFNVVYEWCKNNGYGNFGEPTEKGKLAMRQYEERCPVEPG